MALTLGNFTASAYAPIKAKAAELFNSAAWNKQWNRPTGIFNAFAGSQQIRLGSSRLATLADKRHCELHTVAYLQDEQSTAITPADDVTDCTIDGQEVGSLSKDYAVSEIVRYGRKVIHKTCKEMFDYNEKTAFALENLKSECDLDAEKKALAFIVANNKVLSSLSTSIGTVTGSNWAISSADLTSEFVAELQVQAQLLRMVSPMLVLNKSFYKDKIIADATVNKTNDTNALLTSINHAHNIVDFDSISGGNRFYLVDMATLHYINATEYQNTSPESSVADSYGMKVASRRLMWSDGGTMRNVEYDTIMQRKCTGKSLKNDFSDVWNMVHSGSFGESPLAEGTANPNIVQITVT